MRLDPFGAFAGGLARLDGEQLPLVVPLIERRVLVEALVTLKADKFRPMQRRERLGDLRLADARFAFQEQRPLEKIHHPQRGREIAVGDITD